MQQHRMQSRSPQRRWQAGFCSLLLLLCTGCAPTAGIFAGGSWQTGGLPQEHIQVLAVNPTQLNDVYAGDALDGVFVSTDAGSSWHKSGPGLPMPLAIADLAFDSAGKKLYAATSAGLFVSGDGAQHWTPVDHVAPGAYTSLAFDLNTSQTVYVGSATSGVLKSTDGGATWTSIAAGLPAGEAVTSLLYASDLKQLWAAFSAALYRSVNGGASWQAMDTGLPVGAGINVLRAGEETQGSGSLLFVGTNHGFFLSTDAGEHWVPSQSSLANVHIRAILVDASQANQVYTSTSIGVLSTQDNGQTWVPVGSGLVGSQLASGLVQSGNGYGRLLVAARGVFIYTGGGAFSPALILPLVLIVLFFVVLYRFIVVRRRPRPTSITPE